MAQLPLYLAASSIRPNFCNDSLSEKISFIIKFWPHSRRWKCYLLSGLLGCPAGEQPRLNLSEFASNYGNDKLLTLSMLPGNHSLVIKFNISLSVSNFGNIPDIIISYIWLQCNGNMWIVFTFKFWISLLVTVTSFYQENNFLWLWWQFGEIIM